jgi:hypothetical protein
VAGLAELHGLFPITRALSKKLSRELGLGYPRIRCPDCYGFDCKLKGKGTVMGMDDESDPGKDVSGRRMAANSVGDCDLGSVHVGEAL